MAEPKTRKNTFFAWISIKQMNEFRLTSRQRQRAGIDLSSHGLAPLRIFPKFRSSARSPARVSSLTLGRPMAIGTLT